MEPRRSAFVHQRTYAAKHLVVEAHTTSAMGSMSLKKTNERVKADALHLNRDPLTLLPENMSDEARKQHSSVFNMPETERGWLQRPLRLFMYDVMARAQELSGKGKRRWYVLVPSGRWRVPWAYAILILSSADVWLCTTTFAFCKEPFKSVAYEAVVAIIFLCQMMLNFVSACPTSGGTLELRPRAIARRYIRTTFALDVLGLASTGVDQGAWQWLRLGRWAVHWATHDSFRSVSSSAARSSAIKIVKMLLLVACICHCASCLFIMLVVKSPVCYTTRDQYAAIYRDNDAVLEAIAEHNGYDPLNALPPEPTPLANATNLYVYYVFATLSMLLGDSASGGTRAQETLRALARALARAAHRHDLPSRHHLPCAPSLPCTPPRSPPVPPPARPCPAHTCPQPRARARGCSRCSRWWWASSPLRSSSRR